MRRVWVAVGLIWLPVGGLVAMWAAWSERLPVRIATHWNGWGAPDRFGSTTGTWIALLTVAVVAGLAGVAASVLARLAETAYAGVLRRGAARPGPSAAEVSGGTVFADDCGGGVGSVAALAARRASAAGFLLVAAGAIAGGSAGLWATIAGATLADPQDPRPGWRLLFFVGGLAWSIAVRAMIGRLAQPVLPVSTAVDPLELRPTERAAFSTTLRPPFVLGVVLVAAGLTAVIAALFQPGLWPVVAVLAVIGLLLGRIRVTADRRGLRLAVGPIGVPVKQIALADIAAAEVAQINPMEWGGWGYRVTPGRSALVLRGGPGLVLLLRDGRRFAVTMDEPQVPAALLTALHIQARR